MKNKEIAIKAIENAKAAIKDGLDREDIFAEIVGDNESGTISATEYAINQLEVAKLAISAE